MDSEGKELIQGDDWGGEDKTELIAVHEEWRMKGNKRKQREGAERNREALKSIKTED